MKQETRAVGNEIFITFDDDFVEHFVALTIEEAEQLIQDLQTALYPLRKAKLEAEHECPF